MVSFVALAIGAVALFVVMVAGLNLIFKHEERERRETLKKANQELEAFSIKVTGAKEDTENTKII